MTGTSIPIMIDTITCCVTGQSAHFKFILYYWQVPVFKRIHDNTSPLPQQPKQTWRYWTGCLYKQHMYVQTAHNFKQCPKHSIALLHRYFIAVNTEQNMYQKIAEQCLPPQ